MANMRRAYIGDIHGDLVSFSKLHDTLKSFGVDEVWHCGDLVDRGPDPHGVIQFCIKNNVRGVLGNHDAVIIDHWKSIKKHGKMSTKNADKQQTLLKITQEDVDYLLSLPVIHVFDDIHTILVHGGLHYKLEIWENQPKLACRYQLINSWNTDASKWFHIHRDGTPEEELKKEGWMRWFEKWDGDYNVVFGHTVFKDVMIRTNPDTGRSCIGVDTGAVFGKKLSAIVLPDMVVVEIPNTPKYASMKSEEDNC